MKTLSKSNPVHKNMQKFHKPATHKTKKDYDRKLIDLDPDFNYDLDRMQEHVEDTYISIPDHLITEKDIDDWLQNMEYNE